MSYAYDSRQHRLCATHRTIEPCCYELRIGQYSLIATLLLSSLRAGPPELPAFTAASICSTIRYVSTRHCSTIRY
eukprot:2198471-Rhodomonas_salina.1